MKHQLIKTSPLLSGQVRWDLIVERLDNKSVTNELHIVPLSDDIIFNEDNSRETLNYSHLDNLKYLYRTLQGDFWSTKGHYNSMYALYNQGHILDPFDHTYEMGLRRMRYGRYNKQFSFLCPLWISEDIDYSKLLFKVSISDADPSEEKTTAARKTNIQSTISLSKPIQKYIKDYMSNSDNGDPVDDSLISFKFDPVGAYITGTDVKTGKYQTTTVTDILEDIISRERPMMEFDGMILGAFKDNNIVAQQLINFNLVFNLDDICSFYTSKSLLYHDINISVDILYDGHLLAKKDLYSNYTNIPAYSIEKDDYDISQNVLEYLGDFRSRILAYTNKVVQPIFHWSLLENPTSIYNFYDGFAPTFKDNGELYRVNGLYCNQSNLAVRNYSILENNIEWCKHYELIMQNRDDDIDELMMNPKNYSKIPISDDIMWFSNNKFDMTGFDISGIEYQHIHIMTVKVKKKKQIPNDSTLIYQDDKNYLYYRTKIISDESGKLLTVNFLSNTNDLLTLSSISDIIELSKNTIQSTDDISKITISYISRMFINWIRPYKVEIFKSISERPVEINNIPQQVVEYLKDDNVYRYVYRYTGKIIPCFIDINDEVRYSVNFFYKQWSKPNDLINYTDRIKAGYLPEYPEFIKNDRGIDIIDDNSFYSLYECKFCSKQNNWYSDNKYQGDITWLNDNRIWIFPPLIDLNIIVEDAYRSEDELNERVWNELYNSLKHDTNMSYHFDDQQYDSKWFKQYIRSLYVFELSFDYISNTNINEIKYNIKYRLK